MSIEEALVEDMPLMAVGTKASVPIPQTAADVDDAPEVIAMPAEAQESEEAKPKQGKRRAGTRHMKSAKAA